MKDDNVVILDDEKYKYMNTENKQSSLRNNNFNFYLSGIVAGILGAIGMTVFLKAMALFTGIGPVTLMFLKYIILGVALYWVLSKQRAYLNTQYRFADGIRQGAFTTFIASISMAIMNLVLSGSDGSSGFTKFNETGDTLGSVFVVGGVLFFECLVLGMILTFICLQYLKRKRAGAEMP